jgi:hypothetical protein
LLKPKQKKLQENGSHPLVPNASHGMVPNEVEWMQARSCRNKIRLCDFGIGKKTKCTTSTRAIQSSQLSLHLNEQQKDVKQIAND